MNSMLFFATTEAADDNPGLLGSLGIDVKLLVIQIIAFLLLLWVLTKFVYPVLASMLDKREATIREGVEAAKEAGERATEANAEVEELLSNARKQAAAVIASAKDEAGTIIDTANQNATEQAERIVTKATAEIEKEVESAKQALRDETIDLVALATEKVVGQSVTQTVDKKIIASALKDASKK